MEKITKALNKFETVAVTGFMILMVVMISLATFTRFTKIAIIPWAEELARYLMVWLVYLGIGIGAKDNKLFTVDNLVNALPDKVNKILFLFRTLVIIAFSGFMTYISMGLIGKLKTMGQVSPALQLPMWIVYSAIPIGLILIIIHTLEYAVKKKFSSKKEEIDFEKYV